MAEGRWLADAYGDDIPGEPHPAIWRYWKRAGLGVAIMLVVAWYVSAFSGTASNWIATGAVIAFFLGLFPAHHRATRHNAVGHNSPAGRSSDHGE